MAKRLAIASWICFIAAAAMIRSPSPLLLVLVPAHFVLGLAALLIEGAGRGPRLATAALLAAHWAFLFRTAFLS